MTFGEEILDPYIETRMSDNETTKYTILLVAAIIGLASACISFVNSRLNEAKSADKKNKILVNTAIAVDTVIFLGGCALVSSSIFAGFGFMVLTLSFFTAVALFLGSAIQSLRLAIVDLIVRAFLVIFVILVSVIIPMAKVQRGIIDLQRNTTDILKGFTEALTPQEQKIPNKSEQATPRKPSD